MSNNLTESLPGLIIAANLSTSNETCPEWLQNNTGTVFTSRTIKCLPIIYFQIVCLVLTAACCTILTVRQKRSIRSVLGDAILLPKIMCAIALDSFCCLPRQCLSFARGCFRKRRFLHKYVPLLHWKRTNSDRHDSPRSMDTSEEMESLTSVVTSATHDDEKHIKLDRRANTDNSQDPIPISKGASEVFD